MKKDRKVVVAISGGVDSSVAAALLKKRNFEVIGVFMRLNNFSMEAEMRAKAVAKILNIPFRILDLRKDFQKIVIKYFLDGYKKGITPNPCVICNKEIKFGLLMEKAFKMEADFVATGHYARIKKKFTTYSLLKGKDKNKDQSYFLWKLSQKQLKNILFPLGNYTKEKVRGIARELKLPTFNTPESQEVCFVKDNINIFLNKHIKLKKGNIVDKKGDILGKHKGLPLYTIGQRKGIGLSGGPYYVSGSDLKRNNLIVTENQKDLLKKELTVKNINWISGKIPKLPMKAMVKIRYRSPSATAVIVKLDTRRYGLTFTKSQRAITPGQSAVFYRGQEVLGGGIIN